MGLAQLKKPPQGQIYVRHQSHDRRRVTNARRHIGKNHFATIGLRQGDQFLQTDPIGSKDDLDLYDYVKDDPINGSDSTGLAADCFGKICNPNAGQPPSDDFKKQKKEYDDYQKKNGGRNTRDALRFFAIGPAVGVSLGFGAVGLEALGVGGATVEAGATVESATAAESSALRSGSQAARGARGSPRGEANEAPPPDPNKAPRPPNGTAHTGEPNPHPYETSPPAHDPDTPKTVLGALFRALGQLLDNN